MPAVTRPAPAITVSRQAGALGAVVSGVDLTTDIDDATFELLTPRCSSTS